MKIERRQGNGRRWVHYTRRHNGEMEVLTVHRNNGTFWGAGMDKPMIIVSLAQSREILRSFLADR